MPAGEWARIDAAYSALVAEAPESRKWLLAQTLLSAGPRRLLFQNLPIAPRGRVLDLGCGFGATTCELAVVGAAPAVGVDLDRDVLAVAARASSRLGLTADFALGDAYRLPFEDGSFDAVFSRFVFQHLAHPDRAAEEMRRVLRPGGLVCVVDVDDGLSITEPPPSPAFERLAGALRASQSAAGGDRRIGRKLAALLDRAGLPPSQVLVMPQASYRVPAPGDPERALMLQRLGAARPAVVAGGHMTGEQFDADLAEVAAEVAGPTCEVEAQLAVIAARL